MEDQQEWSMKCSSLNHFYAMNSVSHFCLDKVTFINVSNNALKTEVLWEMSPNCQGSLTHQHIISHETSSLQQQDCDTLKLCIHLLPLMICILVWPILKITKRKTYVHGVRQYTDCKTLWYIKMWKMQAKKRQAYIRNISILNFTLHTAPNFSYLNQLPINGF
jgi:hypothetical protein